MGREGIVMKSGNGDIDMMELEETCAKKDATIVVTNPVSSDSRGEDIQIPLDLTSPNMVLTSPLEVTCIDSQRKFHAPVSPDAHSPRTPKERSFDPFAPGVDELMLAPRGGSKYSQEARSSIARSLNFGSSVKAALDEISESDGDLDEDKLMELSSYGDLLGAILSNQIASLQVETSLDEVFVKQMVLEGFKTPDDAFITGIAETCPPAPMKSARNFRNTNQGFCRKLDF